MTSAPAASPGSQQLTPAQTALWFGQQQVPDSAVYQCAERIDIRGDLDVGAFGEVLTRCLAAVPSLNAEYSSGPDGPRQRPRARAHRLQFLDVSATTDPAKQCDHEIAEFMSDTHSSSEAIAGDRLNDQTLEVVEDPTAVRIAETLRGQGFFLR